MKISSIKISSKHNFGMAKPDYYMQKIFQQQIKKDLKAGDTEQLEKDKCTISRITHDYFPAYDLESDNHYLAKKQEG